MPLGETHNIDMNLILLSLYFRSKIMSDNTMITVYPFDGSLYSFYESPYVYRIEPNSLETQGLMDLGKLGLISHSR
jgi:hypothetical protein